MIALALAAAINSCQASPTPTCVRQVNEAIARACQPFGTGPSVPVDRACSVRDPEGRWVPLPWLVEWRAGAGSMASRSRLARTGPTSRPD
jgi:hypothetical protein